MKPNRDYRLRTFVEIAFILLISFGIVKAVGCNSSAPPPPPPTPAEPTHAEDEEHAPKELDFGANAYKAKHPGPPPHRKLTALPPMPPDPRSAEEIQQAACTAADGSWHCQSATPKSALYRSGASKLLAAGFNSQTYLPKNAPTPFAAAGGVRPPIIPASWTITSWHLNPSTGNDTNDCVTSGTSCQTFAEIVARWGQLNPRLATSNVTIAQHASQSASQLMTDPVRLVPRLGGPSGATSSVWLTYKCDLPTPSTTTTITTVVAKNRTSNPGVELRVTVAAGGGALRLYQNTTHPSFAWARVAQGGAFRMSQPMNTTALNSSGTVAAPMCAEVDSWSSAAGGDAINIYNSLLQVKMTKIRPDTDFQSQFENGYVVVQNCDLAYNTANENNGDNTIDVGRNVMLVDGESDYVMAVDDAYLTDNGSTAGSCNWWYNGGFGGGFRGSTGAAQPGSGSAGYYQILGGMGTSNQAQSPNWNMNGVHLDGDVVLATGSGSANYVFTGYNTMGFVDLEGASVSVAVAGILDIKNFSEYSGNVLWSQLATPAVDSGYGTVVYQAGTTGGATTFPGGVSPKFSGSTSACRFGATSASTGPCNIQIATGADLDTSLGNDAGVGCLCAGVIGCFCNNAL